MDVGAKRATADLLRISHTIKKSEEKGKANRKAMVNTNYYWTVEMLSVLGDVIIKYHDQE